MAQVECLVDEAPARNVVPVHEGHCCSGLAGAACAPYTVQIRLLVLGALVVHHVSDVVNVNTACRHVSGHQHIDLGVTECAQRLLARTLAQVTVNGAGSETAVPQLVGDLRSGALGAGKDDAAATAFGLQNAGEHLNFVHRVCAVDHLLDCLDSCARVVGLRGANVGGLHHVAARELHDGPRHGGREQHGVARGGRGCEQALNVGQEAKVEHLVRLVEHYGADVTQVEVALVEQVNHATRSTDDNFDASLEGLDLWLVGSTAVNLHDAGGAFFGGVNEVTGHLHGQLSRRSNHDCLWLAWLGEFVVPLFTRGDGAVQCRHTKAQRFTGSSFGLANDVVAGQRYRQCHGLNGKRRNNACVC